MVADFDTLTVDVVADKVVVLDSTVVIDEEPPPTAAELSSEVDELQPLPITPNTTKAAAKIAALLFAPFVLPPNIKPNRSHFKRTEKAGPERPALLACSKCKAGRAQTS